MVGVKGTTVIKLDGKSLIKILIETLSLFLMNLFPFSTPTQRLDVNNVTKTQAWICIYEEFRRLTSY